MCRCSACSSTDGQFICQSCVAKDRQVLLDEIQRLQQELLNVGTELSFAKFGLNLRKPPGKVA